MVGTVDTGSNDDNDEYDDEASSFPCFVVSFSFEDLSSILLIFSTMPNARLSIRARGECCIVDKKWPCWPANLIEPLTVTDRTSKLTLIMMYILIAGRNQLPTRARRGARACVGSSVLSTIEKSPCRLGN